MADKNELELKIRIENLVREKFQGDYRRAFDHYAGSRRTSGSMDPHELSDLLRDAGVGNFATRSTWVNAIMERLDKNGDGYISFSELQFLK